MAFPENVEKFCRGLNLYKQLMELNISGCQLSLAASRLVGNYIVFHGKVIKELNVSHCKIAQQGTRYMIDALNRNSTIRYFNFGHNDLSSTLLEYSIKLAAIITRHPNLMHVDLTACSLKREEVLFLGLALSMSKTMLSIHLTGNSLPYYDRIFLRSVIAARVGYRN
jgi:Ran GTPase-activating protein (RanGAP) involved in mRNA processing and transport